MNYDPVGKRSRYGSLPLPSPASHHQPVVLEKTHLVILLPASSPFRKGVLRRDKVKNGTTLVWVVTGCVEGGGWPRTGVTPTTFVPQCHKLSSSCPCPELLLRIPLFTCLNLQLSRTLFSNWSFRRRYRCSRFITLCSPRSQTSSSVQAGTCFDVAVVR